MTMGKRYNGCANWGTWYVGTMLSELEDRCGHGEAYRNLVDSWLAEGYGEMERKSYDELLLAHEECDYEEIAREFPG